MDKSQESPTDEGIGGIGPIRALPHPIVGPKKLSPREIIPLQEYQNPGDRTDRMDRLDRLDSLHKIHAHSSAETSGLGDSLQRIHTLSSTETSGYGDTVPSPTFDPSPVDPIHGLPVNPRPSRSMLHIGNPGGNGGSGGGHSPGGKPHLSAVRLKSASLDDDRYSPTKTHHMYPKPVYVNPNMGTKRHGGYHNPGVYLEGGMIGPHGGPHRGPPVRQVSEDAERRVRRPPSRQGSEEHPHGRVSSRQSLSERDRERDRDRMRGERDRERDRDSLERSSRRSLSRQSLQEEVGLFERMPRRPIRQRSEEDTLSDRRHRTGSPNTVSGRMTPSSGAMHHHHHHRGDPMRRHHRSDGNLAISGADEGYHDDGEKSHVYHRGERGRGPPDTWGGGHHPHGYGPPGGAWAPIHENDGIRRGGEWSMPRGPAHSAEPRPRHQWDEGRHRGRRGSNVSQHTPVGYPPHSRPGSAAATSGKGPGGDILGQMDICASGNDPVVIGQIHPPPPSSHYHHPQHHTSGNVHTPGSSGTLPYTDLHHRSQGGEVDGGANYGQYSTSKHMGVGSGGDGTGVPPADHIGSLVGESPSATYSPTSANFSSTTDPILPGTTTGPGKQRRGSSHRQASPPFPIPSTSHGIAYPPFQQQPGRRTSHSGASDNTSSPGGKLTSRGGTPTQQTFEYQTPRAQSPVKSQRKPMTRSHRNSSRAVDAGIDLTLYSGKGATSGDPGTTGADPKTGSGNEVIMSVPGSRRGSYTPSETPSLSRRSSGQFLGSTSRSTWLTWSQDRRNSFKRRLDVLEQRQKEVDKTRVSTPVRKARKESVMFVSPELESKHVLEDELDCYGLHTTIGGVGGTPATPAEKTVTIPISSKRKRLENKEDIKLTQAQWNGLVAFWEHSTFVRCRYGGTILSLLALILTVSSISNQDWFRQTATEYTGAIYSGLWLECSTMESGAKNCTRLNSKDWQNAVIGLLLFAVAFGFLATILSICGVCTTTLPKKIYYYHSAGEIYFICALSTMAALIIYPVAIETEKKMAEHQYGVGYGLGWGATFFFFAAAMCMCLDDLVRTIAKGLCCGKKDQQRRSRV